MINKFLNKRIGLATTLTIYGFGIIAGLLLKHFFPLN